MLLIFLLTEAVKFVLALSRDKRSLETLISLKGKRLFNVHSTATHLPLFTIATQYVAKDSYAMSKSS